MHYEYKIHMCRQDLVVVEEKTNRVLEPYLFIIPLSPEVCRNMKNSCVNELGCLKIKLVTTLF